MKPSDFVAVLATLCVQAAFSQTPTFASLHTFTGSPSDGSNPLAPVVVGSGGVLYGATSLGGSTNFGTIFSLTPPATTGAPWTEAVLYTFRFSLQRRRQPILQPDRQQQGALFGTAASGGGSSSCGTVFELIPPSMTGGAWRERQLTSSSGFPNDGCFPAGGVVMGKAGVLYGVTSSGGSSNFGVAFSLTNAAGIGG